VSGTFGVPLPVDLAAVAIGAVQGAVFGNRMAHERHIDLVGIAGVGIATGVGGGMLRDLLLEKPVAALSSNLYLTTAVLAALLGMLLADLVNRMELAVVAIDAASLGIWAAVGTYKANGFGFGVVTSVFVGVIACTGGTVIRDLLLRTEVSLVRVGSFYSIAALGGSTTFLAVERISDSATAAVAAILVTFGLRMLAWFFGWRTPRSRALRFPSTTASARPGLARSPALAGQAGRRTRSRPGPPSTPLQVAIQSDCWLTARSETASGVSESKATG